MSCSDCGNDITLKCCDSYLGLNALQFRQCGNYWPSGDCTVQLEIKCVGCGPCGGTQYFEVDGIYNTTAKIQAMLDVFDPATGKCGKPDVFEMPAPGKAIFELDSSVTCRLPKGFRSCDYSVVVTEENGARTTVATGRLSVR